MSRPLILLRPQPGNDESAARARARGLRVVQTPLFAIVAAPPAPPAEGPFDAVLVTSANGARFGAELLRHFASLPVYAVGDATARAVQAVTAAPGITGGGDAASTLPMIAAAGHRAVLHLCGAEVRPFDPLGLRIVRQIVYRTAECPEAGIRAALDGIGAGVVAVHSPRAAMRLAALVPAEGRAHLHLLAISDAAAAAGGSGWSGVSVSERPDDTALLALAETLCNCAVEVRPKERDPQHARREQQS